MSTNGLFVALKPGPPTTESPPKSAKTPPGDTPASPEPEAAKISAPLVPATSFEPPTSYGRRPIKKPGSLLVARSNSGLTELMVAADAGVPVAMIHMPLQFGPPTGGCSTPSTVTVHSQPLGSLKR